MTRIVAGTARGRRLRVPKGDGTRPTTDRVREALFATLGHLLGGFAGVRVLDLFAGSGALGLEAVSRGAGAAVLVERDRVAAAAARANAATLGLAGVSVVVAPVERFLSGAPQRFDVVLADPPYAVSAQDVEAVLRQLTGGWLADDATVVVERATRGAGITWPDGLRELRQGTYGETTLWYGQRAPQREDR